MYKMKNVVSNPNANAFTVLPSGEIVIKDNKGVRLLNQDKYFFEDPYPLQFNVFDDKIMITDMHVQYYIMNASDKQLVEKGKGRGFFDINASDKYLGIVIIEEKKYEFGLLNKEMQLVSKWERNTHGTTNLMVQDTLIVLESLNKAFAVEAGNDKPVWEFSFLSLGNDVKFSQFSGAYENKAVITLNNGGVVILDAKSGTLLKYWDNTKLRWWLMQSEANSPVFYGLSNETFIEIDVNKQELIRQIDISKQLQQSAGDFAFVSASRIENGLIYFIGGKKFIGVFDPGDASIKWVKQPAFKSKGTVLPAAKENIQIVGKEIYVMDSAGDLHIYEPDNN